MFFSERIIKFLIITSIGVIFCVSLSYKTHASAQRTILLINSYHQGYVWTNSIVSACRNVLNENIKNLEIYIEYMDTKRWNGAKQLDIFHDMLELKYAGLKLDLIITTDDNALLFVLKHKEKLFPETPIVFCGVNDYQIAALAEKSGITGVMEVTDIAPTLNLALELWPKANHVGVMSDGSTTGLALRRAFSEIAKNNRNLSFEYLNGEDITTEELIDRVSDFPVNSFIINLIWMRDKDGFLPDNLSVFHTISEKSAAPILGINDTYLNWGIVGGKLNTPKSQGREAARIALEIILEGKHPSELPVITKSINPYIFDYKVMKRFGVAASSLPMDSMVINKPVTFYQKYKSLVIIVCITFTILLCLIIALFLNIFRRSKAEMALQQSENKYRSLFNDALDMIHILDNQGLIIDVNQIELQTMGYTREEYIGMPLIELIHPDDRPRAEKILQNIMRKAPVGIFEIAFVTKLGKKIDVEVNVTSQEENGRISSLRAISRNISERKRAEQDRILLASVIEQVEESVIVTDRDGTIQYVNPAFEHVTGYSREEAIGQNPRILKSDKQSEEFYAELWAAISNGRTWIGRMVNKKKDGSFYEEEATILPVKNINDEVVSFVAVKRDVTQEIELKRRLRQSQKMEAVGTLAGGIAHDFNNILGIMIGYSELCHDELKDNPELSQYISEILKAGERAKDLVQQILAFSRQTEKEKRPVRISNIVKEVVKFIRASLPSTIQINLQINTTVDIIIADATQIYQVLMNLCTNAAYAMRDSGGELTINLENVQIDQNDLIKYPDLEAADYIKLSVSDTGCGISKEAQERIFDPYFTTKKKGEGTGLGLAVVHGIVKDHGGDIGIYSEVGKGALFYVLLPLKEKDDASFQHMPDLHIPTGNETILLVDDEPSLVAMNKKMLEKIGYSVVGVSNPADALELFKKDKDMFDAVITDKTMPQITGFELSQEIREMSRDIPILMYTGFLERDDIGKAEAVGINEIIMKPLVMQTIAQKIRYHLD